jgi:hypothetical protein
MVTPPSFLEDGTPMKGSKSTKKKKQEKNPKNMLQAKIKEGGSGLEVVSEEVSAEFNAVRFLGQTLKKIAEENRKQQANKK